MSSLEPWASKSSPCFQEVMWDTLTIGALGADEMGIPGLHAKGRPYVLRHPRRCRWELGALHSQSEHLTGRLGGLRASAKGEGRGKS